MKSWILARFVAPAAKRRLRQVALVLESGISGAQCVRDARASRGMTDGAELALAHLSLVVLEIARELRAEADR